MTSYFLVKIWTGMNVRTNRVLDTTTSSLYVMVKIDHFCLGHKYLGGVGLYEWMTRKLTLTFRSQISNFHSSCHNIQYSRATTHR